MDFRPEQPMHNRYAVTSLHYYFPWAITALVRWSAYAELDTDRYQEWCQMHLPHLPERVLEWVDSPAFSQLLDQEGSWGIGR